MKKLLIIKLGGSIITYKDSLVPKARRSVIKRLAKEIKEVYDQGYKLILVHGGGSFAHPIVKKFGIHKGMQTQEQKLGFGITNLGMINLNVLLIAAFLKLNIPAISLPPHSFIKRAKNKLQFKTDLINDYLSQNMVPVLFGVMILDQSINCSVLSGDTIIPYLSRIFKPEKVIYLTDVDGIFDCDPKKNPNAKLIQEINNTNLNEVLAGITLNNHNDVTGEMQGKLLEIKSGLKDIEVIVTSGLRSGSLVKVVGQSQVGTRLQFD